jgi:hypothetical protein
MGQGGFRSKDERENQDFTEKQSMLLSAKMHFEPKYSAFLHTCPKDSRFKAKMHGNSP